MFEIGFCAVMSGLDSRITTQIVFSTSSGAVTGGIIAQILIYMSATPVKLPIRSIFVIDAVDDGSRYYRSLWDVIL